MSADSDFVTRSKDGPLLKNHSNEYSEIHNTLLKLTQTGREATLSSKWIGYVRKSVDDQQDNVSLVHQKQILKDWAEKYGYCIELVFEDVSSGSTLRKRPGLQQAIDTLIDSKQDYVGIVSYRMDRFSRKTEDVMSLLREIDDHDKNYASASEPELFFGYLSPLGKNNLEQRMSLLIKCLIAEAERINIITRTRDSAHQRRVKHLGQSAYSPYGTRFQGVCSDGSFVLSHEIKVVKSRVSPDHVIKLVPHSEEVNQMVSLYNFFVRSVSIGEICGNKLPMGRILLAHLKKSKTNVNYRNTGGKETQMLENSSLLRTNFVKYVNRNHAELLSTLNVNL